MKNTKEKIIKTAQRLFNQQGLESVSIRGIASEMGISHGNLMYHFDNKDVLTRALLQKNRVQFEALSAQNKGEVDDLFMDFCIKHRWIWCGKRELKNMGMHEELDQFEDIEREFWEQARPVFNSKIMMWLTEAWLMRVPLGQKSGFEPYIESFRDALAELPANKSKSRNPKTGQTTSRKKTTNPSEDPNSVQGSLF